MNFGIIGSNTKNIIDILKDKVVKYNPNILILLHNDLDWAGSYGYYLNDKDYKSINDKLFYKLVLLVNRLDNFLSNNIYTIRILDYTLINKLSSRKIKWEKERLGKENIWKLIEEPLIELLNISKKFNMQVIILDINNELKLEIPYKVKNFSNKNSFVYVRPIEYMLNRKIYRIHPLDPHPNEEGHKILAESLYNTIIENNLIPN